MNHPVFFSESNTISENDAKSYAKKLKIFLKWGANEEVLDVGCGTGNVTKNVIIPMVPETVKQIIALDISKEMLEFAKKYPDSRIKYIQQDIASKIPEDFEEKFDHIFSFYCLHWVKDQSAAFKNLNKMLKPGGQMMMTIIAESSNYIVLKELSKIEKWHEFMKDFDQESFPYQFSESPKDLLEKHLLENHFTIHHIEIEIKSFNFTKPNFIKFILALNPYIKHIPIMEQNAFVENYLERIMKLDTVDSTVKKKGGSWVTFTYQAMSVFVSKI